VSSVDWGAVVTGAGVIVALCFNAVGLRDTRRQSRAAAERAEAAAALASDNNAALVAAIREISLEGGAAIDEHVSWSLSPDTGSLFRLENVGPVAAYDVAVETDPSLIVRNFEGDRSLVGAREAITFVAIITIGTVDTTVTVTWFESADRSGAQFRWRYPLPRSG